MAELDESKVYDDNQLEESDEDLEIFDFTIIR